jgi:hypothetical protein
MRGFKIVGCFMLHKLTQIKNKNAIEQEIRAETEYPVSQIFFFIPFIYYNLSTSRDNE